MHFPVICRQISKMAPPCAVSTTMGPPQRATELSNQ